MDVRAEGGGTGASGGNEARRRPRYAFYAFDFDGVLCDSAGETGTAGLTALRRLVPSTPEVDLDEFLAAFRVVRPALETGWESVPIAHLLAAGRPAPDVAAGLHGSGLIDLVLAEIGRTVEDVKEAFLEARERAIADDVEAWLALHGFYSGAVGAVAGLVRGGEASVYVITTKAKDFAIRLLARCGVEVPEDRVFGLGSGPKAEVLAMLVAKHTSGAATVSDDGEGSGGGAATAGGPSSSADGACGGGGGETGSDVRCLFVEDRVKTLLDVQASPVAKHVDMLLADWGYNTDADRRTAAERGISVCSQEELAEVCGLAAAGGGGSA